MLHDNTRLYGCPLTRNAFEADEVVAATTCALLACAGATLLDGLDTLWIMDMKQEFARARDWVAHNMTMDLYVSRAPQQC